MLTPTVAGTHRAYSPLPKFVIYPSEAEPIMIGVLRNASRHQVKRIQRLYPWHFSRTELDYFLSLLDSSVVNYDSLPVVVLRTGIRGCTIAMDYFYYQSPGYWSQAGT